MGTKANLAYVESTRYFLQNSNYLSFYFNLFCIGDRACVETVSSLRWVENSAGASLELIKCEIHSFRACQNYVIFLPVPQTTVSFLKMTFIHVHIC